MAVQIIVSVDKLVDDESVPDPEFHSIVAIDFKVVHLWILWQQEAGPLNANVIACDLLNNFASTPVYVKEGIVLCHIGSSTEPTIGIVTPLKATLNEQVGC